MRRISTFLSGVAAVTLSSPAFAQAAPVQATPEIVDTQDDTGELAPSNEIVVSARRREESVQDVPQTVNVVTAAQVEKLNLRNFTEIQTVVPGLQLQTQSAFSNTATVRGIAFEPAVSGANASVEFYLNDAPISSAFLFQSTFDFGQFELQRGPQGTLRGRAAPSGSIAVTTRRPDLNEVGAVFNGTYTDLHARKVDGAFNIPIIRDILAVRVAGVIDNDRAGQVHSLKEQTDPLNSEGPFRRTKAIRGTVRFEPADWAHFNFMAQDLKNQTHGYSQVASNSLFVTGAPQTGTLIRPFDRLSIQDVGSYNQQDQIVYVGNADFRFGGQRLAYVGSYSKQTFNVLAESDAADFFAPPRIALAPRGFGDPVGFRPVCQDAARLQGANTNSNAYFQCTHTVSKAETHELRLQSEERIANIFDYVVGGFYAHTSVPSDLTQETPLVIALADIGVPSPNFTTAGVQLTPIQRRGGTTEKSVFGNLTAHLLDDRLELSGGLRHIDFKFPVQTLTIGTSVSPTPKESPSATIYTASAKYKINDDIMVYALTGSSFRPGPRVIGNFSLGPTGTGQTARELAFTNLPPERSRSYEVGAKTSFLNGRGRFNVSAFYQKFRNYPFRGPSAFYLNYSLVNGVLTPSVASAGGVGAFSFVAPVPVTVKGVEAEASFQITDRWNIGANASYADGKVKNGTVACTDLNGDGVPDINPAQPTIAQLQVAVGAGQAVDVCSGINRSSTTAPKFSANVQSEFGFDVGASMDGFVRGLYTFNGKTPNDPDNLLDDVSAYGILNLFAGVRDNDGAWELTIFAKNVLREREILNVSALPASTSFTRLLPPTFRVPGSGLYTSEYRGVSVTAPREFGVTARIALGSR
jgi:iron complex outermembrane receptor protein